MTQGLETTHRLLATRAMERTNRAKAQNARQPREQKRFLDAAEQNKKEIEELEKEQAQASEQK